MKSFKRLLLLTIIGSLALLICSCELFEGLKTHTHVCSYDDVTVISEVGCDSDGITVRSCTCGRISTEITSAYGHSFGDWVITSQPSCSERGSEQRVCENCGICEDKTIATVYHDYSVTEEIIGDRVVNRYLCALCGECFDLESDISLPEADGKPKYVFDVAEDFSFTIFCPEGEKYIREHLKIFSYVGGEDILSPYLLTSEGNGVFRVTPDGGYTRGLSYVARRSSGVVFPEYGLGDLVFTIQKEETVNIEGGEGVIYIAALESQDPGYYPYNLHYSKASGDYFLALEKADGLSAGQLICVGNAKNFDELLFSKEENTFGRITSITQLSDGRMLVAMSQPSLDEIFTALEVYTSEISFFDQAYFTEDFPNRIKNALLSDEDYAKMLDAFYSSAEEFVSQSDLTLGFESFSDFVAAITATAEECSTDITETDGILTAQSRCGVLCTADIPVLLGEDEIGRVCLQLRVYVVISGVEANIQLDNGEYTNGRLIFSFSIGHKVAVGFELDTYSSILYSPDSELFLMEKETGIYHRAGCDETAELGKNKLTSVSILNMHRLIQTGADLIECEKCLPVSYCTKYISILDSDDMLIHSPVCTSTVTDAAESTVYAETDARNLTEMGYSYCPDCADSKTDSRFEEIMTEKLTSYVPGNYSETLNVTSSAGEITIGKFIMSLSGIDCEVISVSVIPDFRNLGALRYSYEYTQSFDASFRSSYDGMVRQQTATAGSLTKDGRPVTEATEYFVGCTTDVSVSLCGFGYTVNENLTFKTDTIVGLE